MIERAVKRSIHCPVCGRYLLKANDGSEIEVACEKCNSNIIAKVVDGMVSVSEDRRGKIPVRQPAVSVSINHVGKKKRVTREVAYV